MRFILPTAPLNASVAAVATRPALHAALTNIVSHSVHLCERQQLQPALPPRPRPSSLCSSSSLLDLTESAERMSECASKRANEQCDVFPATPEWTKCPLSDHRRPRRDSPWSRPQTCTASQPAIQPSLHLPPPVRSLARSSPHSCLHLRCPRALLPPLSLLSLCAPTRLHKIGYSKVSSISLS